MWKAGKDLKQMEISCIAGGDRGGVIILKLWTRVSYKVKHAVTQVLIQWNTIHQERLEPST